MPNQSDPTQNLNTTLPPVKKPDDQSATPPIPLVVFPQSHLPPLTPEFQSISKTDTPPSNPGPEPVIPNVNQPVTGDGGSGTVPNISSVISKPKKKYGGGKIIATILGLVVLIGGIGAGIILTQQQQLFKQKASGLSGCLCPSDAAAKGVVCVVSNGINYVKLDANQASCSYCNWGWEGGVCCPGGGDSCSPVGSIRCTQHPQVQECKQWNSSCSKGVWKPTAYYSTIPKICADSRCQNESFCQSPTTPPTVPPTQHPTATPSHYPTATATPKVSPTPSPTASPTFSPTASPGAPSCITIKAYDDGWTVLTEVQLTALNPGDVVNFCVNGDAPSGTFDKAQFMINTTIKPESTTKRLNSNDFCQTYTVLSTDTTMNIKAKIHHSNGIWIGESF